MSMEKPPAVEEKSSGFPSIDERAIAGGVALYRERMGQLAEFMLLLDESLNIIYMSPTIETLFGYTQADLSGKDLFSFLHPEDIEEATAGMGRILSGNTRLSRPEFRIRTKHGCWRTTEIVGADCLADPAVRAIVLLGRDVSERKTAEQSLKESRELFATAFHASNDICAITVPETGEFIDVNRKWLETLGYERSEVIGNNSVDLGIWASENTREELLQAFSKAGSLHDYESQIRTRSGELRAVLVSAEELDVLGEPRLYFSVRDVTEAKRTAEQLLHSQKMEAIGQLTGGIAHDFNNLLSVILGNTELMRSETSDHTDLSGYLDEIQKAAKRGSMLTRSLLEFSRKQSLQPQVFFPQVRLMQMLEMLQRSLGEDIAIEITTDPTPWSCFADPAQFENVVLNIALNARDAMTEGGKLSVVVENKTIDDSVPEVESGDYIRLAFKDTGSGMSEAVMEHVFEPFFTTKEVGKGTGLGLSMVFGFVKQSGGYLAVESELGKGTLMKFMLPRHAEEER